MPTPPSPTPPPGATPPPPPAPASARRDLRLIGGLFALLVVVLFVLAPDGTRQDFWVFHRAGQRYLRGEDLYRLSDGHFAYKYAPTVAAFFAPFGLLPERLGWLAINLVSLLALGRVVAWSEAQLGRLPTRLEQALFLALAAPWYGHLFWLGQSDGLVLLLLVESEARAERQPLRSGALWALACLVKPPFLVIGLVALLGRQWRRIAGLALGAVGWLVVGVARFGPARGLDQLRGWRLLLGQSTPELLCNEWNQGAWAMTCTYLAPYGSPWFFPSLAAVAAGLVGGGLWAVRAIAAGDPARGRFALGAFGFYLGAVLSPLGWNTNLVTVIPLGLALAACAVDGGSAPIRRGALAACLLVALLNCVDLILLPGQLLKVWGDSTLLLLQLRQYGVAGLVAVGASLACQAAGARGRAA